MKSFFLTVVFVILGAADLPAKSYYTTKDKIRSGYKDVVESGNGSYLNCSGAGESECKYKDGHIPVIRPQLEEIEQSVMLHIEEGELTGLECFEGGCYSWQAAPEGEVQYVVTIFDEQ